MSYTKSEVMNAIVKALGELKRDVDVRTVDVYSGQLTDMNKSQTLPILPAVLVGMRGSEISDEIKYTEHHALTFHIICIADSLKSQSARNSDAVALVDAVEAKLHRQDLGLNLTGYISVVSSELIASGQNAVAYGVEIIVEFEKVYAQ